MVAEEIYGEKFTEFFHVAGKVSIYNIDILRTALQNYYVTKNKMQPERVLNDNLRHLIK